MRENIIGFAFISINKLVHVLASDSDCFNYIPVVISKSFLAVTAILMWSLEPFQSFLEYIGGKVEYCKLICENVIQELNLKSSYFQLVYQRMKENGKECS